MLHPKMDGGEFDPTSCGFSKNVHSKERMKACFFILDKFFLKYERKGVGGRWNWPPSRRKTYPKKAQSVVSYNGIIRTFSSLSILFFLEKVSSIKKASKRKINDFHPLKRSCAHKKLPLLFSVWLIFACVFFTLKIFSQKKINKQTWNCPDNLIILYYYPEHLYLFLLIATPSNVLTCLYDVFLNYLLDLQKRNRV